MRAAIIREIAARLADEQPGTPIENYFQARSVKFRRVSQERARRESKIL